MSLPGDENPNPQWQRREAEPGPQWTSGDPLGEQPQREWEREPKPQWQQAAPPQSYHGWVPPPRTPGQAYAAMILGIVGLVACPIVPSILALVFGYLARNEIGRSGGQLGGSGIALTGVILGWVGVGLWAVFVVALIAINL